jgi:hypothetical protein
VCTVLVEEEVMAKWPFGAIVLSLALATSCPAVTSALKPSPQQLSYRPLPNPGKRVPLDAGHYFTYAFNKAPKVGTCIVRVEIFTSDGRRDTSFQVKGDADMPSMRGAHASGDRDFALSNKGVFLLPVNLVMPGDWELRLTFVKNGRPVLGGLHLFDL